MLEPVERGIQRALLNLQRVARDLLDAQQDPVAVRRAERDRLEDEQVERTLQQLGGGGQAPSPWMTRRAYAPDS
jgi:hypothetical protein